MRVCTASSSRTTFSLACALTVCAGVAGSMIGGCALDGSVNTNSSTPSGDAPRTTATSQPDRTGPVSGGVEADRSQIQASLSTMDQMDDGSIPQSAMQALIDDGLYDPKNESPLVVGEMAPDFAATPLRFYNYEIETEAITKANAGSMYEPIRLSAFRDKLPVVLIFGSYT